MGARPPASSSKSTDHVPLARLVVQEVATYPTPWPQPAGALLVSPRVSSVGRYPADANRRDFLSLRVLQGASLLHVGLPLPAALDQGMLRGLQPASLQLPRGAAGVLGLQEDAATDGVAQALLQHPLCTPLHASPQALEQLPPMLVTIGMMRVGVLTQQQIVRPQPQGSWRRMEQILRLLWGAWSRLVVVCRCTAVVTCFMIMLSCLFFARPVFDRGRTLLGVG